MAENWLETRCRNSGETQTSLSFRFPEAKQTKETGLEAGTAQGRHGGQGQARPLGGTSPAAATREAGSSGARGRGTQIPRLGALGAAIARVQAPGDPPPSALRASPARDAWEQGTGHPTHPPRPPSAAPPGPKRPTFPEPGAAPRGGAATPGAGRDGRVPSPRWVLPYSQWVSLGERLGSLKKKKETLLKWRFPLNAVFRNSRPGVAVANHSQVITIFTFGFKNMVVSRGWRGAVVDHLPMSRRSRFDSRGKAREGCGLGPQ